MLFNFIIFAAKKRATFLWIVLEIFKMLYATQNKPPNGYVNDIEMV